MKNAYYYATLIVVLIFVTACKPNIESNDSEERIRALELYADDQTFLAEIALSDSSLEVKEAAVKLINDKELIMQLAIGRGRVAEFAIEKIEDEEFLMKIVFEGHSIKAAIDKIRDQVRLADIIIRLSSLKNVPSYDHESVIGKISDQELLADMIIRLSSLKNAPSYDRASVINKISDQELLASIPIRSYDKVASDLAIEKIGDENQLAFIALNGRKEWMRSRALQEIENELVLTEIAKTDSSYSIRSDALDKIHKQENLLEIALGGGKLGTGNPVSGSTYLHKWEFDLRVVACKRLNFESCLKIAAKKADLSRVRVIAASTINDQEFLRELVEENDDMHVRIVAFKALEDVGGVGQKSLFEIANSKTFDKAHDETRLKAVENLTDQEALLEFALNVYSHSSNDKFILAAIDKMHDQELLTRFIVEYEDRMYSSGRGNPKMVALRKIDQPKQLLQLIFDAPNRYTWATARRELNLTHTSNLLPYKNLIEPSKYDILYTAISALEGIPLSEDRFKYMDHSLSLVQILSSELMVKALGRITSLSANLETRSVSYQRSNDQKTVIKVKHKITFNVSFSKFPNQDFVSSWGEFDFLSKYTVSVSGGVSNDAVSDFLGSSNIGIGMETDLADVKFEDLFEKIFSVLPKESVVSLAENEFYPVREAAKKVLNSM